MDYHKMLQLTEGELAEIPGWYLGIAFNQESPEEEKEFEAFEFLGDAVYDIVINNYIYQERIPGAYYSLKSNTDQSCFFSRTGACDGLPYLSVIEYSKTVYKWGKPCADRLEAIIGIVYSYLLRVEAEAPIFIITKWLAKLLDFDIVRRYSKGESVYIPCGSGYKFRWFDGPPELFEESPEFIEEEEAPVKNVIAVLPSTKATSSANVTPSTPATKTTPPIPQVKVTPPIPQVKVTSPVKVTPSIPPVKVTPPARATLSIPPIPPVKVTSPARATPSIPPARATSPVKVTSSAPPIPPVKVTSQARATRSKKSKKSKKSERPS